MFVQSALMDMHLRCGSVADASRLFAEMERKDVVSWNALIRGFVEHRHYSDALGLFASMLRDGMLIILFTDMKYFAYLYAPHDLKPTRPPVPLAYH
jgi:pentatricopeptide repeat protein